jgi:alpha-L-fucosidase
MGVVERHQPGAMVFNLGRPTIRWVGNEDGLAQDPVRYAVAATSLSQYTDASGRLGEQRYLPPECDVSLRRGWFWSEDDEPKTLEHLLAIHERSVGLGAGLLLNVPPAPDGLVSREDADRVAAFGAEVARRYGQPAVARIERPGDGVWLAEWDEPETFDVVELREDLADGQRVDGFRVLVDGLEVGRGGSVGLRRLVRVPATTTRGLTVEADGEGAALVTVAAHRAGPEPQAPQGYAAPTTRPDER